VEENVFTNLALSTQFQTFGVETDQAYYAKQTLDYVKQKLFSDAPSQPYKLVVIDSLINS